MGNGAVRGMIFGAAAIGFALFSIATRTETPPAGYALLDYGLIGAGAAGFLGSLVMYLKSK